MYTRKQNVFIAKKMLTEIIYNSAYVEGCNVTFPQTEAILQGMRINNVKLDDIQTIINLRNAWRFVLNNLDEPLNLNFINKVNENILWNEYIPPIPDDKTVSDKLKDIESISNPIESAVEYFAWATRAQLYWDGNKRTSTLVANAILIKHGAGVFTIGEDTANEFNDCLRHLYNTEDA